MMRSLLLRETNHSSLEQLNPDLIHELLEEVNMLGNKEDSLNDTMDEGRPLVNQTAPNLFNNLTTLFQKDKIPITDKQLLVLVRNLEMIRGFNLVKARFTQPAKYDKKNAEHEEKLQTVSITQQQFSYYWFSFGPR